MILKLLRVDRQVALATGITLGQIGEFAFVLAAAGRDSGLIGPDLFAGVVSVTMLSMFLAPYMVSYADPLAEAIIDRFYKRKAPADAPDEAVEGKKVLIVGFGPAGRKVAEILDGLNVAAEILELNPAALESAAQEGRVMHLGDATKPDVLDHAGVHAAVVVVVTIPDSRTAAGMIRAIRMLVPEVKIIARGRYHRHIDLLKEAGASLVVDEERLVGERLAAATVDGLSESGVLAMACRMIGKSPEPPSSATPPASEKTPGPVSTKP